MSDEKQPDMDVARMFRDLEAAHERACLSYFVSGVLYGVGGALCVVWAFSRLTG
jgi:hypothetical protein